MVVRSWVFSCCSLFGHRGKEGRKGKKREEKTISVLCFILKNGKFHSSETLREIVDLRLRWLEFES